MQTPIKVPIFPPKDLQIQLLSKIPLMSKLITQSIGTEVVRDVYWTLPCPIDFIFDFDLTKAQFSQAYNIMQGHF